MQTDVVQRVRVTFGVHWPLCYASVLDLGRLWERLLRRAHARLAYTQGYNPHPRLAFAAALPVGYTSDAEVVDVLLAERAEFGALRREMRRQAPEGLAIGDLVEVPLSSPALQAVMREARYRVTLYGAEHDNVIGALKGLLARPSISRKRVRKGEVREYDLRPLIRDAQLHRDRHGEQALDVRMVCGPEGSGRPEELIEELGVPIEDYAVRRIALIWEGGATPHSRHKQETQS